MKGIVFTEFIEMVESKFGFELTQKIIDQSILPSGGAYTAVGTYDFSEMLQLVTQLSNESGMQIPELLFTFGHHLFSRFSQVYPHFFEGKKSTFDFMSQIENHIHVEVLKLYPDAELPKIQATVSDDGQVMTIVYHSKRKLSDLAHGLMVGCAEYFKETISIKKSSEENSGKTVTFQLIKEK